MFESNDELNQEEALNLLEELELSKPEDVAELRRIDSFPFKCEATLLPGNASEWKECENQGMTRQISKRSILAVFKKTVSVGDVFRVQFDPEKLDIPHVYALCERCRIVGDQGYEAFLSFFIPIEFPADMKTI